MDSLEKIICMSYRSMERYLSPTSVIDCKSAAIKEKAQDLTEKEEEVTEKAKTIFYFVRDEIKYNFYTSISSFKASDTLKRGEGICAQKAVLLTALARCIQIPSRIGFADIRNHLIPQKLAEIMGTNLLAHHTYTQLYLHGKWVKATPSFDLGMCNRNMIIPVEFDGENDAMFHSCDQNGNLHIEYVRHYGYREDFPVDEFINASTQVYGFNFVYEWKKGLLG